MRRLIKLLEQTSALDVDEAVSLVSQEVTAAAVGPQEDDWTFMMADWRADARGRAIL